jgi:hypothetical protein
MKTCKDRAFIKWTDLDGIIHNLKSDIQVLNGVELTIRRTWVDKLANEDLKPIVDHLNRLRWRLQDRLKQLDEVIEANDK